MEEIDTQVKNQVLQILNTFFGNCNEIDVLCIHYSKPGHVFVKVKDSNNCVMHGILDIRLSTQELGKNPIIIWGNAE